MAHNNELKFRDLCEKVVVLLLTLCEKCPYSELFWSVFSHIWTEYGEIHHISPFSVRMRENTNQKNSEYGHFSRIVILGTMRKQTFVTIAVYNLILFDDKVVLISNKTL